MSEGLYKLTISVWDIDPSKLEDIKSALDREWLIDFFDTNGTAIEAEGESHISHGETKELYAKTISSEIRRANGGRCKINLRFTYLEDLPYEDFKYE